jgi:hypothetical protein
MAKKVYKITEAQAKLLKKIINENTALSAEAQAYYAQQNKQPEPPEQEESKAEVAESQPDMDNNALVNQVLAKGLEALGFQPGANGSAGTNPAAAVPSKDSTQAIQVSQGNGSTKAPIDEEQPISNQKTTPMNTHNGDWDFTTKVQADSMFYDHMGAAFGIPEGTQIDSLKGELTVQWTLEIEARKSGVNSLFTVIKSVAGFLTAEYYDDPVNGRLQEKQIEFNGEGFKIEDNITVGSQIAPAQAEINFQDKTIEIS